jgi:hypothetical protein
MAAGTPVVSLRGDWHSEHLVDAANGFWANNLEDMCSHILKIGQDQELFRKLQQGAWQTGQYFCAKHLALQLEKLYHEATSLKQKMFYRT